MTFFSLLAKKTWNFLYLDLKKEPYTSQVLLKLWLIGNRTLCRPVWSVIILVIKQIGLLRFCYNHSYDHSPNWLHSGCPVTITNTLLWHLFNMDTLLLWTVFFVHGESPQIFLQIQISLYGHPMQTKDTIFLPN